MKLLELQSVVQMEIVEDYHLLDHATVMLFAVMKKTAVMTNNIYVQVS